MIALDCDMEEERMGTSFVAGGQVGDFEKLRIKLLGEAYKTNTPMSISFELTPKCNLSCKMCYVHLEDCEIKHAILTTEQWIRLIDEAYEAGMTFATLTGGEALYYPGFKAIYQHLCDLGVIITLKTNGVLLDQKMIEFLVERPPYCTTISVYGGSEEAYEAVTGKRVFSLVDRNIRNAKSAGLAINIALTVSKYMAPYFKDTLSYVQSTGLVYNMSSYLIDAREDTGRHLDEYGLSLNEMIDAIRYRRMTEGVYNSKGTADPEVIEELRDAPEYGLRCGAGRTGCTIDWDGTMRACMGVEGGNGYPLRDGFAAAWMQVNQAVRSARFPSECKTCEIKDQCSYCPTQHHASLASLRIDPHVCKCLKELAKA